MGQPPANDPGVIFFLVIVGLILLAGIAYAVLLVARWNANRIRYVTPSRVRSYPLRPDDRRFSAVSRAETNSETPETARALAETEQEKITFAETAVAEAMARLIIAKELDLTKAVKIGCEAKSGTKYQKHSALVKAAVDRLTDHYPPTDPAALAERKRLMEV